MLTSSARSTRPMLAASRQPVFSRRRRLSMVRICSSSTMELRVKPQRVDRWEYGLAGPVCRCGW